MKNLAKKLIAKKAVHKNSCHFKKSDIAKLISHYMEILFPAFSSSSYKTESDLTLHIQRGEIRLQGQLAKFISHDEAAKIAKGFTRKLGDISDQLDLDVKAILSGDPAATNRDEVILSYPGFFAIAVYRIAHFFYKKKVPTFPRMLCEYAHQVTGIDIHPGATIGESFCIDHGTGVVIGETTRIGKNVKVYQGVTLGALSVKKSARNTKRHPTIEDNCVIYSNATILGGKTVIGKNTIVGGNVWLTKSVPKDTIVYNKSEMKLSSQIKHKI